MQHLKSKPTYLYKIATAQQWDKMCEFGIQHNQGSALDQTDGYLHLSLSHQVERIAKKYFSGKDELKLIIVTYSVVSELIKWEPNSKGELFPHSYGQLPTEAVSNVLTIESQDYDFNRFKY
tara:strand:- start:35887 stop:36249 length:363 start_codon:yes stop_codon:yes gene_type:complete